MTSEYPSLEFRAPLEELAIFSVELVFASRVALQVALSSRKKPAPLDWLILTGVAFGLYPFGDANG